MDLSGLNGNKLDFYDSFTVQDMKKAFEAGMEYENAILNNSRDHVKPKDEIDFNKWINKYIEY